MTLGALVRFGVGMPLLALFTALATPLQIVFVRRWKPGARRIALCWHRLALRIIGVRVHVHGAIATNKPLLIVANHVSWSDILVLGSVAELCFVAKSQVRSWPGINLLAWMQRTVFIDRERRRKAALQADTIAARLLEGDVMVLFPEGTTGDGHRVLPFKSALFGSIHTAAKASGVGSVTVQPVAIAYTRLHGLPLGRLHQARAAWPGDVALTPHLISFLREGAYDVSVVFCPEIEFSGETARKTMARACYDTVRREFAAAMRMRPLPANTAA